MTAGPVAGRFASRGRVEVLEATEHSTVPLFQAAPTLPPDCPRVPAPARQTIPARAARLESPTQHQLRAEVRRLQREPPSRVPSAIPAGQRHGPRPRVSERPRTPGIVA